MKFFLSLACSLALSFAAYAQLSVKGVITDQQSQKALVDASVHLVSSNNIVKTQLSDESGNFTFSNVKPGSYKLAISFVGYKTFEQVIEVTQNLDNLQISMEQATAVQEQVLVEATRAKETGATTYSTVTSKDIRKQNFGQDLPFLLNLTPSTVINSDAGAGVGYTGIRIRGVDPSRTNVTINGVPINDAESQGTFWVDLPDLASSVDNIQVQRGVGTSTNGSGAFGASINIQTDGLNDKPYAELANSYGSFNTHKNTAKFGTGLLQNQWAFDGRLSLIKSDGFIDRASSDLKSFFLSGARYGKKSLLKANVFSGKETTYQAWNGIPEARLNGDVQGMNDLATNLGMDQQALDHMLNSGNRTYNEFTYKNQTDNYQQDYYQLFYTYRPITELKLNAGLYYTYGRGYYEEYRKDEPLSQYKLDNVILGGDTITNSDIVRRRWLDNNLYGGVFSAIYEKNKLTLTLGGGANEYDGKQYGELIWAQYASNSQLGTHFYDGKSVKKDMNVYGKANYKLFNNLEVFADLQYRYINYKLSGEDLDGSTYRPYNLNLEYKFFNPKAGFTYFLNKEMNVYGYFGIANREPERNDIIRADAISVPHSERLYNYEFGFRRTTTKAAYTLNFYYMDYKDQLVSTGQINDVGAYNRVNVPKSYRAGVEATAGFQIVKMLKWQITATYSQNKIQSFTEYVDNWDDGSQVTVVHKNSSIAFSPDWIASSMLTFTPVKQLNIDLISKYVGKQYLDNTQSENRKLNAFFVNDIRINYDLPVTWIFNQVRVGLLVNNILNEKYEPNGYTFSGIMSGQRYDFNYYFPQAGRNVLANLVLRF